MWTRLTHVAQVLLAASPYPRPHPAPRPLVDAETAQGIEAARAQWGVPGLAVSVVASPAFMDAYTAGNMDDEGDEDGWHTEVLTFGDATAAGDAVDQDTLFAIASNSKLFTALAVGLLVHNGTVLPDGQRLGYDTKIRDVIPGDEWKLRDEYMSDHVEVRDLLSMYSGLPSHDYSVKPGPVPLTLAKMRHLRASTGIRGAIQYSNIHYVVAARLVEHASGLPFADYVGEHILSPLGMNATYNWTAARGSGHWSDGYAPALPLDVEACSAALAVAGSGSPTAFRMPHSCVGDLEPIAFLRDTPNLFLAGSAGLVASARDMGLWLRELLAPRVLPRAVVEAAEHARHVIDEGLFPEMAPVTTYGFAQTITSYRGHRLLLHGGNVPGHMTQVVRLPELGLGISTLGNAGVIGDPFNMYIIFRIIDALLCLPPIDWERRLAHYLVKLHDHTGTPLPTNPAPPPTGWHAIPGTYTDAAYGDVRIQPAEDALNPDELAFIRSYANILNTSAPMFVGDTGAYFGSRLVFTHFDGPVFNVTVLTTHPRVDTNSTVPIHMGMFPAVITDTGIGAFGEAWRGGRDVPWRHPVVGEGTEEAAEFWLARVV